MSPFDTPGPTPGPKGGVKQHNTMASGFEVPISKRRVKTFQSEKTTGCGYSPGLNASKKRNK